MGAWGDKRRQGPRGHCKARANYVGFLDHFKDFGFCPNDIWSCCKTLNQGVMWADLYFKKGSPRLIVWTRWCRVISLHSSPLSIAVIPRNNAKDNQWRALKGAKRKANWFVTSGLEEQQHRGRASYVSSNQQKTWPNQALHDSWPTHRRWHREANSFHGSNRSPSNVIGRAWCHWQRDQLGSQLIISGQAKCTSSSQAWNFSHHQETSHGGGWVAPAKWVPLQQAA